RQHEDRAALVSKRALAQAHSARPAEASVPGARLAGRAHASSAGERWHRQPGGMIMEKRSRQSPKRVSRHKAAADPQTSNGQEERHLAGRLASEIGKESVVWLWWPWIPRGMLTLIVGNPSVGKSTFLAGLMAMATGGPSLDGMGRHKAGRVLLLPGYEESFRV